MDTLEKLLKSAIKNEIRLSLRKPDAPLSPLSSRLGGKPAVPADFIWPYYPEQSDERRPLAFIAQIDLNDIAELDDENLLPKSGMLSFFYELEEMTWGFDPADKGSARVFYFPDVSELSIPASPDLTEGYAELPEFALDFEKNISIPSYEDFDPDGEFDCDDFYECAVRLGYDIDEEINRTKLLGYPDLIQEPMSEECEMVFRGFGCGSPEDHAMISEEEKADIRAQADEWILLFQVGSIMDDDSELMFGDCGNIYYWIRKKDLLDRIFDNAWLILQCG